MRALPSSFEKRLCLNQVTSKLDRNSATSNERHCQTNVTSRGQFDKTSRQVSNGNRTCTIRTLCCAEPEAIAEMDAAPL